MSTPRMKFDRAINNPALYTRTTPSIANGTDLGDRYHMPQTTKICWTTYLFGKSELKDKKFLHSHSLTLI